MIKCPECKSKKIKYCPEISGNRPHLTYKQNEGGEWVAVLKGSKCGNTNQNDDMSKINIEDLYYNDSRPFMYCESCTMEFDG